MQKNGLASSCVPVIYKGILLIGICGEEKIGKENMKLELDSVQELMQRLGSLKVGFKRDVQFWNMHNKKVFIGEIS